MPYIRVLILLFIFLGCSKSKSGSNHPSLEREWDRLDRDYFVASEADLFWSLTVPAGDFVYAGGTIDSSDLPSAYIAKVSKASGDIVEASRDQSNFPGLYNYYDLESVEDRIYAIGYKPSDAAGTGSALIRVFDLDLNEHDFKEKHFSPSANHSAGFLRGALHVQGDQKILYAAGFATLKGTTGVKQDWYVAAIDLATGDLIHEAVTFTPEMGYGCDDEANDVITNDHGVYVIGQVHSACENSEVRPSTVILKFDHNLNYIDAYHYADSQGYALVSGEQGLVAAISDGVYPTADLSFIVLNFDLKEQFVTKAGFPGYNQPWALDRKGNVIAVAGFRVIDAENCSTAPCSYWQQSIWTWDSSNLYKAHEDDIRTGDARQVNQAHAIAFDRSENSLSYYSAGCVRGQAPDAFSGCVVIGKDPEYSDAAIVKKLLPKL